MVIIRVMIGGNVGEDREIVEVEVELRMEPEVKPSSGELPSENREGKTKREVEQACGDMAEG